MDYFNYNLAVTSNMTVHNPYTIYIFMYKLTLSKIFKVLFIIQDGSKNLISIKMYILQKVHDLGK